MKPRCGLGTGGIGERAVAHFPGLTRSAALRLQQDSCLLGGGQEGGLRLPAPSPSQVGTCDQAAELPGGPGHYAVVGIFS